MRCQYIKTKKEKRIVEKSGGHIWSWAEWNGMNFDISFFFLMQHDYRYPPLLPSERRVRLLSVELLREEQAEEVRHIDKNKRRWYIPNSE